MGIKGKTTFELTDVNTGKVERYEHNNMVTNGLSNLFNTYGTWQGDPNSYSNPKGTAYNYNNNPWIWMTGGLMLFDRAIEENANKWFMPAGATMVGNGSYDVAYTGEVAELGTYNTLESGVQEDGSIRYVYDFSTSQANGTIQCACLTSNIGGLIGMGNASGYYSANNYIVGRMRNDNEMGKRPALTWENRNYGAWDCLAYPVYDEDAIYIVDPQSIRYAGSNYQEQRNRWWSSSGIIIHKMRSGFKTIGFLDGQDISKKLQTWELAVPQEIKDYMADPNGGFYTYYVSAYSDPFTRSIYIVFACRTTSVDANNAFWVMKIDRNMSVSAHRVTNNTGKRIYLPVTGKSTDTEVVFDGDYMYLWAEGYQLCRIKYADSTQVELLPITKSSTDPLCHFAPGIIGVGEYTTSGYNTYYYPFRIYDAVAGTYKSTNGYDEVVLKFVPFADRPGTYLWERATVESNTVTGMYYQLIKDPRYLATINNLDSPVVKTASKTMKVTYTLTPEG